MYRPPPIFDVGTPERGHSVIDVQPIDMAHPRVVGGPHGHQDLEILYFCSGSGVHELRGQRWPIQAGDVTVIPPRVVHDLSGMIDGRGWAVQFSSAALEPVPGASAPVQLWWSNPLLRPFLATGDQTAAGVFPVPAADRPRWELILRGLEQEQNERRPGAEQAMGAYLFLLVLAVARAASDVEATLIRRQEPVLAHTFGVIESRFGQPLSTRDVADAVGMSPGHLTTLVRERTGKTVGDWILERRMTEARWLLTSTDLPAESIAGQVGFTDPAYFNRRFRQLHGQPPGVWRR